MKKTFNRQHQEQKENAFSNNLKLTFSILQLTEYQQGAVLTTEMRMFVKFQSAWRRIYNR